MAPSPLENLKRNSGQALIEGLALAGTMMAAITVLFGVLYFGFVHVGANYLLHELIVCEATQGEKDCEKVFRKKAGSFLIAAKIRFLDKRRGRLVLEMPMKRKLTLQKKMRI